MRDEYGITSMKSFEGKIEHIPFGKINMNVNLNEPYMETFGSRHHRMAEEIKKYHEKFLNERGEEGEITTIYIGQKFPRGNIVSRIINKISFT